MTDPADPSHSSSESSPRPIRRAWRVLIGAPRSLGDVGLLERLSLIPVLAWVGLGADGLSSSAYGPEEAFVTLGQHRYLAVALAVVMAATVFIISAAYSRIIEEFPHGGGGYLVASKLLGERIGLVSGAALLVDYVLTITISIAAAGDAAFSFLPLEWHHWKLTAEAISILGLTTLNLRGVRESVLVLTPIFFAFVISHVVLILAGLIEHRGAMTATTAAVAQGFQSGFATVGFAGLGLLLVHSYSLGGGTYTGIEAVSNGLSIMREPRVATGKRTMLYMAASLAFTASGLLVCYLLWDVSRVEGKTLNAVLAERVLSGWPFGQTLLVATLVTEGALLVVAAQAGFIGGPRVLGNMAVDSWVPHRFSALSDRLTTQNGILLMGGASLAALAYTGGSVSQIVVMYSINVFFTFSMSMLGMLLSWIRGRKAREQWKRRVLLFLVGFVLCATILAITVFEKFLEGGWITILVTGLLVVLCFLIRGHYGRVSSALAELYAQLAVPSRESRVASSGQVLDPNRPTAAVLVNSYGGLGIHTVLNILRSFPGHYANLIFLSVGVIDSGAFKGQATLKLLREDTEAFLVKYVEYARGLGLPADYRLGFGTDAVEESERLCLDLTRDFPRVTFFAGKVIFRRERWYQRILHNETAVAIQRRLQFDGWPMVILPAKLA